MSVNNWFDNGCDYATGVMLYMQQKTHSKNLLSLFMKKENIPNHEKLKYELGKFKTTEVSTFKVSTQAIAPPKINPQVDNSTIELQVEKKVDKAHVHYFYRLNELPLDLHPLAIQQRNDFQTAISLKLKLNPLHEMEEGAALALCIEIENLFDAIDMAQKVLKHYVKHKVVLDIQPFDFSDLTPDQRYIRLKNKRSSIAKLKKRIQSAEKELSAELPISRKTKLQTQIQKSSENLLKQEHEVQELMNYINGK